MVATWQWSEGSQEAVIPSPGGEGFSKSYRFQVPYPLSLQRVIARFDAGGYRTFGVDTSPLAIATGYIYMTVDVNQDPKFRRIFDGRAALALGQVPTVTLLSAPAATYTLTPAHELVTDQTVRQKAQGPVTNPLEVVVNTGWHPLPFSDTTNYQYASFWYSMKLWVLTSQQNP